MTNMKKITLVCPNCHMTMEADRMSYDPPRAAVAEILCPECCDDLLAHEPTTDYKDKDGEYITFEEVTDWWDRNV